MGKTDGGKARIEFQEETNANANITKYISVVENQFRVLEATIHSLEHYFLVELDNYDLTSRESWIKQHWLPIDQLKDYDLKPPIVRDMVADDSWRTLQHPIDYRWH
ncbi:MAG: hypothetical protein ACFFB3_15405 [Candidatus Hodarchaeota archaeon]